jgi:hypothetical protein
MMDHLNEEQLVQHYYGDQDGRGGREQHLGECQDCRAEFARLESILGIVSDAPVPERGEEYGTDVWNRVRAHLPEKQKHHWFDLLRQPRQWAVVGALAVLLIVAFVLGRISKPEAPAPQVAKNDAGKDRKVLLVALGDHLDRSQMVLVELSNLPKTGEVDISQEQQRAQELVASNRLYRQAAEKNGDADLASVLDDLERVLVGVAHEPSQANGAEMASIRQRIESKGILFKVRVIGSKVRNDERRPAAQDDPGSGSSSRQTT